MLHVAALFEIQAQQEQQDLATQEEITCCCVQQFRGYCQFRKHPAFCLSALVVLWFFLYVWKETSLHLTELGLVDSSNDSYLCTKINRKRRISILSCFRIQFNETAQICHR